MGYVSFREGSGAIKKRQLPIEIVFFVVVDGSRRRFLPPKVGFSQVISGSNRRGP